MGGLNINDFNGDIISDTTFNINEVEAGIGLTDSKAQFNDMISAIRTPIERATLEPISSAIGHVNDYQDVPQKLRYYENSLNKTLLDIRTEQSLVSSSSGSDQYGLSVLRYLPETYIGLRLPLTMYSKAFVPTKGLKSSGVTSGFLSGGLESSAYFDFREGYRDISPMERGMAFLGGGLVGHGLGKAHRGFNAGRGNPVDDFYVDEMVKNSMKFTSNTSANVFASGSKARAIVGTGSVLALSGVVSPEELEGSWFNSAFKISIKSTDDVSTVIAKNIDEVGDVSFALRLSEKELVPSLSDYQNVAKEDLVSGFLEGIGYEVGKAFKKGNQSNAIDDIVNQSTLREKNAPLEAETVLRQQIEDILPAGIGKNDEVRESLGHIFRTGATTDDIKAFLSGSKIKEDIAMSNLFNKLDDNAMTKLQKAIDDIAINTFDKSIKTPTGKNSKTVLKNLGLDESLARYVDDIIVSRGLNNMPKQHIENLRKVASSNPREVSQIFGFRKALNDKTDNLIKGGSLKQEDADFAFSSSTYKGIDPDTRTVNLSADEMAQVDKVQVVSKTLNKLFKNNNMRVISKKKLDDGTYEVELANRNDFVQGPILSKKEVARSRVDNKLKETVPLSKFRGTPARVKSILEINRNLTKSKFDSITIQEHNAIKADLINKGFEVNDFSYVTHSAQPLSRAEQVGLGLSDDIADVSGKTIADVQRELGTESMYTRVKNEYSTVLTGENPNEFINNFTSDPKYIFISTENKAISNPEMMQTIANNYIKIDDPVLRLKSGSDFVLKEHAFTLMGYNKVYATQYTYSMSRFIENIHRDMVQVFRTSVVLKNPVSMVNNVVAMSFTNFAYQYLSKGKLSGKAFTGLTGSYRGYKDFVNARANLMKMKASGATSESMMLYRNKFLDGTPAYELYKRGGLQSLLDDGLADRALSQSKSGTIEYGVRSIFLAGDTKSGRVARQISDMGDITNRINMFDELVKDGMSYDQASREVQRMAVNYTRILNPSFNFARETGLTPFITWYSRFLPQFAKLVSDNPMRAAKLQGMYLAMQFTAGEEDTYGNNYIAGVNVNNWWAFNSFNPDSIGDVFNGPITGLVTGDFSPKSLIPAHINQVLDDRVRLVTTR